MKKANDFWKRINEVGGRLNVPPATIRKWKHRGNIPAKWHYPLLEAAKKSKIRLTIKELNSETLGANSFYGGGA
jgi:uncharacterized protein YjcR